MKALVLTAYGVLEYRDAPEPRIGPGDVLVRVRACGICGSDVHGMDGSSGRRIPPVIMGHEASGAIAEVGAAVSVWKPGDRVAFDSMISCGECWHCRRGEINLCDARRVLGVSCEEYRRDGAFAEYVVVPARILCRIPEGVDFPEAAMAEPLSVAVHAVRLAQPGVGESAVVVGAGMIGLLLVQVLRASGCAPVISLDLDAGRRGRALAVGADIALDPRGPELPRAVLDRTEGRGADMAFEAVGVSAAVQSATAAVRKGGRVVLVGNIAAKADLPLQAVVTRQIALLGSCASQGEFAAGLGLIEAGRVILDQLVSARAPLAEGAAWFARLREPGTPLLKVILEPGAGQGGER
jgi:L-iditol 2-dehydrogenase